MRIQSISLTTLLAAGAAAVAIVAAPAAVAKPTGTHPDNARTACSSTDPGTECVTPGNAQINDALPAVHNFYPYGDFGLVLGGDGGTYHGPMHGGNFGGDGGR